MKPELLKLSGITDRNKNSADSRTDFGSTLKNNEKQGNN